MKYPQWVLDDLRESGLTELDAERLHLEYLDPQQTFELVGIRSESYRFPYFDADGHPNGHYRLLLRDHPPIH
jgi:hypothetical protein